MSQLLKLGSQVQVSGCDATVTQISKDGVTFKLNKTGQEIKVTLKETEKALDKQA